MTKWTRSISAFLKEELERLEVGNETQQRELLINFGFEIFKQNEENEEVYFRFPR